MLENIEIARPCGADWAKMSGDERVRFCQLCTLNVYNLSNMTRAEAEALVREKEGKLCVRFFRREDGTVLTQDCPVGLATRVRRRVALVTTSVLAGCAALLSACTGQRQELDGSLVENPSRPPVTTALEATKTDKTVEPRKTEKPEKTEKTGELTSTDKTVEPAKPVEPQPNKGRWMTGAPCPPKKPEDKTPEPAKQGG